MHRAKPRQLQYPILNIFLTTWFLQSKSTQSIILFVPSFSAARLQQDRLEEPKACHKGRPLAPGNAPPALGGDMLQAYHTCQKMGSHLSYGAIRHHCHRLLRHTFREDQNQPTVQSSF